MTGWFRVLRRKRWWPLWALLIVVALDLAFPPPLDTAFEGGSRLVLAADGAPLRAFVGSSGTWRYPVRPGDVSPFYLDALLTYEDRWFRWHPGVNPVALLRAVGQAIRHGGVISGGSTLTMQVARLIEPIPRTVPGKLLQIVRALQIERRLDKETILSIYLERAPFGGTIEGVEAASWAYLGKPSRSLSRAEAALLAVLPQSPSRLRPDRHPEAARGARDKVLRRLETMAVWDRAAVDEADAEAVVARRLVPPLDAPLLAERLVRESGGERVIRTTIDRALQQLFERRIHERMATLPPRTSAAALLVDNATREVRAYVGSGAFGDLDRLGHVDMIAAVRSPGSTLKPFLYGLAIDAGLIHSGSLLVDAPQSFDGYRPANFGDFFHGPVTASEALQRSLNVPAVDLLHRLTPESFTARLRHGGVRLRLPKAARPNLSLILGGVGARMDELAGAYVALSNSGQGGALKFRQDQSVAPRTILSSGAAWIVRDMLESAPLPDGLSVRGGSRPRLAWKTGTSYGYRDAWAFGVTPTWTVAVWIGRPDGTPLPGQFGAATALPVLVSLVDGLPRVASDRIAAAPPGNVSRATICWPTGVVESPDRGALCHQTREAWLLDGNQPPTLPTADLRDASRVVTVMIDAKTGLRVTPDCASGETAVIAVARWPLLAEPWLDAATRSRSTPPRLQRACAATEQVGRTLHLDGVVPGAVFRRAPGAVNEPSITLRVRGTDERVDWLVNGVRQASLGARQPFVHRLEHTGTYKVMAIDASGQYASLVVSRLPE